MSSSITYDQFAGEYSITFPAQPESNVTLNGDKDMSKINTKNSVFEKLLKPATKSSVPASAPKPVGAPVFRKETPPAVARGGGNRPSKFHLEQFEQGMAFDVEKKSLNTVLAWGKRHGFHYVSRTTPSTPAGCVSVYHMGVKKKQQS